MSSSRIESPPQPPFELRQLVGPTEDRDYDNPSGGLVFPGIAPEAYDFVLDFGCGCGRLARQLLQQHPRPRRYVGVDLHLGMIEWCRASYSSLAPEFEFHHHNVLNLGLNPAGTADVMAFPVPDGAVTLFLAWSVFTHVSEAAATFYLREVGRVLHPEGTALTTWFVFDKSDFPMMQEFQNALFINDIDPTNAVIFDRSWLRRTVAAAGLDIREIIPPVVRGFQWQLRLARARPDAPVVEFPEDAADRGVVRAPLMPANAERLGRSGD